MRATIFQRPTASLKNFKKALNWSRVAACRAEAEKFCRARCRSHTAGSGTRSFREWPGICLPRLFTMSIAACADSHGQLYNRLELQCEGMEFATEMIIKASLHGARIAEIPITLHPDGRKTQAPHLRTVRDGWRTLRFFLVFSPRWLFLVPGFIFALLGLAGYAVALPGLTIGGVTFDAHTLLFSSLAIMMGYQSVLFAICAKTFAINEGLLPKDPRIDRFFKVIYLERGLAIGALAFLAGLILLGAAVLQWKSAHFGRLDYAVTMRWVIPGATLTALGFQTVLSSFFVSILGMKRRL